MKAEKWSPERLLAEVVSAAYALPSCAAIQPHTWHTIVLHPSGRGNQRHLVCALTALLVVYGRLDLNERWLVTIEAKVRKLLAEHDVDGPAMTSFLHGFDVYSPDFEDDWVLAGRCARAELVDDIGYLDVSASASWPGAVLGY